MLVWYLIRLLKLNQNSDTLKEFLNVQQCLSITYCSISKGKIKVGLLPWIMYQIPSEKMLACSMLVFIKVCAKLRRYQVFLILHLQRFKPGEPWSIAFAKYCEVIHTFCDFFSLKILNVNYLWLCYQFLSPKCF